MDFCNANHRSLSSIVLLNYEMYVANQHRRTIVFTKDRLTNIFKFYAYLSNKGNVPEAT